MNSACVVTDGLTIPLLPNGDHADWAGAGVLGTRAPISRITAT
jgi:hypothetical protein